MKLKIAFLAALSDKKLEQKLLPLLSLEETVSVDLYRRFEPRFTHEKLRWVSLPVFISQSVVLSELFRFMKLFFCAWKYDLIIGCFQKYHGVWAMIAGRIFGKKVVQIVISDVDWNKGKFLPWTAMMNADACAVRGGASERKLREYGFKGAVEIIHNPVVMENLSISSADKKYDLIAVGDFAEEKDYPWMLEVFSELKKELPSFRAVICGKGHIQKLGHLIDKLGLSENLEFPGSLGRQELKEKYISSRALILTSSTEGLPMVLVEAMSYALPVLSSNVGEIPWLVRNGEDGFIFEHGNTETAVASALDLLRNDERQRNMGKNAAQRIKQLEHEFSIDGIAGHWKKMLAKIFQTVA